MTRVSTRWHGADLAAAGYVLLYLGWLAVRTPGTPGAIFVGELAFYPLGLAVAWANWKNSTTPDLDARTRLGWRLMAAAALTLWLSGSAWSFVLSHSGLSAWPLWIDLLEPLQSVLAVAGYLCFPNQSPTRGTRTRLVLDISLTVVAGFVLAFHFGIRDVLRTSSGPAVPLGVTGALLDWALFVVAAVGFVLKRDAVIRAVMGILLAANLVYVLANHAFAGLVAYQIGDAVDGVWFGAWVLRWTAARFASHRYRQDATRAAARGRPATEYRGGAFAYLMIAGAFALLIGQILTGDREFLSVIALSAGVMVALLLVRQFVELQDNRRLFAAQLAQEARFRSLVQQSSDVVLVVDSAGHVSYASESTARVFGPGAPASPGARIEDLVPPEDVAALATIFERDRGATPVQTRMRTAAGEWRDVEIVWSDLRGDRAVGGIVLNCRDVTERNGLERQLQHAQKLDAVGHLAGGLAHDFNNVLMVIRGYTELLKEDVPDGTPAADDLAHMEEAVDRAAAVTKKLLTFSRRQPVQPRVLDLNGVLRGLQPLFRQLLTDRIEFRLDCADDLWRVRADPGQIEQVVLNLATNARDAMPDGGMMRIETANRTLPADATGGTHEAPGEYVEVVVSDSGCGMTDDVRGRIFEPFFTTKAKDRGIGLGLAMVHGIVTAAGGRITVRTAPGHGTSFSILLPRTAAPAEDELAPGTAAHAPLGLCTVLVVDDEYSVRGIARRFLERAGYQVIEAADGLEALDIVGRPETRVDLLLTDMVMPGIHGTELIRRLNRIRPGVPAVTMTGFAGHPTAAPEAAPAGVVLTKPFSSDSLLRAVSTARAAPASP